MRVRFGECLFDTGARLLTRAGTAVEIPPKAFRLLEYLIERRPQAVTQQELRDALWPGTHTGYTSLAKAVNQARQAIGDDPDDSKWLRTVRGFGYAFSDAAAEESPTKPPGLLCWLQWEGHEYALQEGDNLIGRDPVCQVRIPSKRLSRRHARIRVAGDRAALEDLGSKNGTLFGGEILKGTMALADGDEFLVGGELLRFSSAHSVASTETDIRGLDDFRKRGV